MNPLYVEFGSGRERARATLIGAVVDRPVPLDPKDRSTDGDRFPSAIIAVEFAAPKSTVDDIRRLVTKGAYIEFQSRYMGSRIFSCARPPSAYRLCTATLPGGWTHALLVHPHATIPGIQELRGQAHCYLIEPGHSGTKERLLTHFTAVLQALTLIPVLPHWASPLWGLGVQRGLIVPTMISEGMQAWKIMPDSWTDVVREAVRSRILSAEAIPEASSQRGAR
jgi:hypothetical protein